MRHSIEHEAASLLSEILDHWMVQNGWLTFELRNPPIEVLPSGISFPMGAGGPGMAQAGARVYDPCAEGRPPIPDETLSKCNLGENAERQSGNVFRSRQKMAPDTTGSGTSTTHARQRS